MWTFIIVSSRKNKIWQLNHPLREPLLIYTNYCERKSKASKNSLIQERMQMCGLTG